MEVTDFPEVEVVAVVGDEKRAMLWWNGVQVSGRREGNEGQGGHGRENLDTKMGNELF